MKKLTVAECEAILASEGMTAMSMTTYDTREGQAVRMSDDGEYSLTDFMESDNCPETLAIISQLAEWGTEFLQDEFGAEEIDEPYVEEAPRKKLAWLKRR